VFAQTPTQMRAARRLDSVATGAGTISLRLPFRRPLQPRILFEFLAARAIPGVEIGGSFGYRRTVRLPRGAAIVEVGDLTAAADPTPIWNKQGWLPCTLTLCDVRDLSAAVARARRLLDLDADAAAIAEALGTDDVLGHAVRKMPGLRVPGHVDGFEIAMRAVLGQQVSVAGARRLAKRLTNAYGDESPIADSTLTHLFPTARAIAGADLATLPMPKSRGRALLGLAEAVANGSIDLDFGADRERTSAELLALPGIGPWTVAYVRMRALADPDVFMPTDLGVRRGLSNLGQHRDAAAIEALSRRWRPWRSYALQYAWVASNDATDAGEEKSA
jgi:AraC family transcriptional regulator, regulatory protein of adaptative response / DNA-3-methyladenine glycosylase II